MLAAKSAFRSAIPTAFAADTQLMEVLHTRDFANVFYDIQKRFVKIYKRGDQGSGILFRASKPALLKSDHHFVFMVPDDVIEKILIDECRKRKIMLPKLAEKRVIAPDLCVGLQIVISQLRLELAD